MSYDKALAALENRVKELEDLPQVAFENSIFVPKTNTPYIRTRFMPFDRRPASCGVGNNGKPFLQKYQGIFQLLLNYPESKGQGPTNRMVNEICDKFEAATDISFQGMYLTIKQVERMRGISDAPWFKTPVNIHWFSYHNE